MSATPAIDLSGLLEWVKQYASENPRPKCTPSAYDPSVVRDIVSSCLIPPFQVVWVEGESVHHREFFKKDEAETCFNSLPLDKHKRLTLKGAEVRRHAPGRSEWPLQWVPDHPAAYHHMCNFFSEQELLKLGDVCRRTRIKFNHHMSLCSHGMSLRCQHTRVPLCIINPTTPDKRYVILHEMMHHQLDFLGTPCLVCPQIARNGTGDATFGGIRVPEGHWMHHINSHVDPTFMGNCVKHIWELIQHARFNIFIEKHFQCTPALARDKEYSEFIEGRALYSYCNAATDAHPVRRVMMAVHLATVLLECSPPTQQRMRRMLEGEGERGRDIVALGEQLDANIQRADLEVCDMGEEDAEAMTGGMLLDLEKVLQVLVPHFCVEVGDLRALPSLHDTAPALSPTSSSARGGDDAITAPELQPVMTAAAAAAAAA
eukprot:CAMPEP_0181290732 /NCGR_PEP_ID=MMETSP1101-20121128/1572_1 /TAXON_ID=46948 /ORGANISM="Rhodomonas abbreviata, Strain Caron Lab Isolate" /LENGTH=429 /DNA_ID=CAMNT_0023395039 /DNA_START=74 /DNA_END=1361 /DNA_ORIENTATION=-